ncbi:hypothetical protein Gpo141_00011332 [Globisporangium polare]
MRGAQFAYDPAEKPLPAAAASATPDRAPLYHAEGQRQAIAASAPPLSDDPRFAPQQYAQQQLPPAPPQYQYQQQQQQQQIGRYDNQPLPGNYGHGSFRHQQSQPQQPYAQQGSFQYYPPGQYAPQQQQEPLLPQYAGGNQGYPTSGIVFHPAIRTKNSRRPLLTRMLKLIGFHTLNAVLGFAAFSLLSAGVSSSITLIPMCCFGIVVFRIVLFGVHVLAQLDVMLLNFASPPSEQVFLEKPLETGVTGVVLAPSLESFSPVSLLSLLYFLSVKFGVAILSCACAAMTVIPAVALVLSASGGSKVDIQIGSSKYSYRDDGAAFVVATVCITLIGAALMILVAKLSMKATKFFCCEPFATFAPRGPPGYQQQARQPSREFTVRSYVSYGSST